MAMAMAMLVTTTTTTQPKSARHPGRVRACAGASVARGVRLGVGIAPARRGWTVGVTLRPLSLARVSSSDGDGDEDEDGEGEEVSRGGGRLTSKDRKALRGLANRAGKAVVSVQVGAAGLSPAVLDSAEDALRANELIKVRVGAAEDRVEFKQIAEDMARSLDAEIVGTVGRVAILFRPNADNALANTLSLSGR